MTAVACGRWLGMEISGFAMREAALIRAALTDDEWESRSRRCRSNHQAYRDGMEDQLGALGLVLNAIVLWTTMCIDAVVAQLQDEGHELREEDIARLSPLKHRILNLLGRYSFTASTPAAGALRPLRDPGASELDEDDGDEA
jgi:hypothetical protein